MITQVCPIQGCALRLKLISSNKSSYLARIEIRDKRYEVVFFRIYSNIIEIRDKSKRDLLRPFEVLFRK
jgi:hypothetical protein